MPLAYTLHVANAGPSTATGIVVTDPVPAGFVVNVGALPPGCGFATGTVTCSLANLGPGAASDVVIAGTVASTVLHGATLTNTATVTRAEPDPNAANDTSTATTGVNRVADLSLTKSDAPDPAHAGGPLTYTLNPVNNGPSVATGPVTIVDNLPPGFTVTNAGGCAVSPSGTTVTCTVPGGAAVGAFGPFTITGTIDASLAPGTVLTNTAVISERGTRPDAGQQHRDRIDHGRRARRSLDHQVRDAEPGRRGSERHLHGHRHQRRDRRTPRVSTSPTSSRPASPSSSATPSQGRLRTGARPRELHHRHRSVGRDAHDHHRRDRAVEPGPGDVVDEHRDRRRDDAGPEPGQQPDDAHDPDDPAHRSVDHEGADDVTRGRGSEPRLHADRRRTRDRRRSTASWPPTSCRSASGSRALSEPGFVRSFAGIVTVQPRHARRRRCRHDQPRGGDPVGFTGDVRHQQRERRPDRARHQPGRTTRHR